MWPTPRFALLVVAVVPYVLFMTRQPGQFERWVYPLLPAVAVLGAGGLLWSLQLVRDRTRAIDRRWSQAAVILLLVIVLIPAGYRGGSLAVRRARTSTFGLAEAWLAGHAEDSHVVMAGRGWLDLDRVGFTVERVEGIEEVLAYHPFQRAAYDWLLVPEPSLTLMRSELGEPQAEFLAGEGWSSRLGYDFAVYAGSATRTSRLALVEIPGQHANRYLGPEWRPPVGPGYRVPSNARVFLPLTPERSQVLRLELAYDAEVGGLEAELNGRPLEIACTSRLPSDGSSAAPPAAVARREICQVVLPGSLARQRPDILRLTPSADGLVWLSSLQLSIVATMR